MNRRSLILHSQQGYNLVGTLVAIAAGALIAVLLASIIREAVRGQRMITDRDEMSEFTVFVRNLLTTDATCSAVLNGKPFEPNGKLELELNVGYGDQPTAVLKNGFTFANGQISIQDLSIEDKSANTVEFRVGISNGKTLREIKVRRHMARIKLQLRNKLSSALFRSRFFEVPILYNLETKKIELCNNDVNVADACQALGYRWDISSSPPRCVMADSCLYGGAYTSRRDGTCRTNDMNPATNECTCPSGYTPVSAGSVNLLGNCSKGCDSILYDTIIQCFNCPSAGGP